MTSLTIAAGDLRHAIVQMRQDRTAATSRRRKGPHELSELVRSELHAHRTSRQELSERQRRQLATFMTDLTANVGSMRDRLRVGLETMRVAQRGELSAFVTHLSADVGTVLKGFRQEIRTTDTVIHQQLDAYRRDRQGASDAWHGRKAPAKSPAPMATAQPPVHGAAMGSGLRSAVVNVEAAPKAAAPPAVSSATGRTPPPMPAHVAPQQHAATPARPAVGSHTPTHGGKTS
jgi:hypothetical protein